MVSLTKHGVFKASRTDHKNLTTLWLLKGLESAWFPIPVIVLFYESQGLSIAQAVLLKAILSAAIFVGKFRRVILPINLAAKIVSCWGRVCGWWVG